MIIVTPPESSVIIFYFSGTGNTKHVTGLLCSEFHARGCTVDIYAVEDLIKQKASIDINRYDHVGFGYPVHAFNAPRIFFDFLAQLPDGNNRHTFVFKTSGDPLMQAGSTAFVRRVLQKKGYHVTYEQLMVMPANVILRYKDALIKQLHLCAVRKASQMVTAVLARRIHLQRNSLLLSIITALFSSMESIGARFLGKYFSVSPSCTKCGACISLCPTQNISMKNNHIAFDMACSLCMRCIYSCPAGAISPGFFKFFVITPWYNLQKISTNLAIPEVYVTSTTKGYFRHYYKYLTQK